MPRAKNFSSILPATTVVVDLMTGEMRPMKLFVAVMGRRLYFCAAAGHEQIADWIGVHVDLFAILGGVPKFVVCDNLKAPAPTRIVMSRV
jgi:transposase